MIVAKVFGMSPQTLALIAVVFSATSQAINLATLARKLLERRVRRLERKLHIHALPREIEPDVITVADIIEIRIKRPPR